jgi:hypothetical protein
LTDRVSYRLQSLLLTFRYSREKEHERKKDTEARNGEIDPLHIFQCLLVLSNTDKDSVGTENWRNHSTHAIEGLRNVDSEFRVSRWPTNGDVWVRRRFERSKTIANDEDSRTEAAEGFVQEAWPRNQRADSVQRKAPNEDDFVSIVP